MLPHLNGTLPVTPFTDRFFGKLEGDGQSARIAALACTLTGELLLVTLVGNTTSMSAILTHIFANQDVTLALEADVVWTPPSGSLRRPMTALHQSEIALAGVRERMTLCYAESASIAVGLKSVPTFRDTADGTAAGVPRATTRHVFANWGEAAPHPAAWFGHLRALRIPHLPAWADAFWDAAVTHQLVFPVPALGIHAWQISGNIDDWSALLREELTAGHLPHH